MKRLLFIICTLLCLHGVSTAQNCQAMYMYGGNAASPLTVAFYDSSYVTNGGTVGSWTWLFGDGGSSHDQNPVHTYAADGIYSVCLTIRDTFNGITCSNSFCDTVTVGTPPVSCNVGFQYTSGSTGLINFFGYAQSTNLTYAWTFGDGGTSSAQNPTHTYAANGRYEACVNVYAYDTHGNVTCTAGFCDSVTVTNAPPAGCAASYALAIYGPTANFISTSVNSDSNTTYIWDFGDGHTGNGPSINHTYLNVGTYTACLNVINATGTTILCTSQYCHPVTITTPITCGVGFQYVQTSSGVTNFTATSTGINPTYTWDFGDGTILGPTYVNPVSHTYANTGVYYLVNVTVEAHGADTSVICTSSHFDSVYVTPHIPCSAAYQYTASTINPSEIHFQEYAAGNGLNYAWTFGDGASGTGHDPAHTYTAPGYYLVCLTISDTIGQCTDTRCDSILVGSPPTTHCSASFQPVTSATNANEFYFVNSSSGNGHLTYTWTFGDGDSSTQFAPTHNYLHTSMYSVCLTITDINANGLITCSSTLCDTVAPGNTQPTGPFTLSGSVFNGPTNLSTDAIVYLITLDSLNLVAIDSVLAPHGLYTFNNVAGGQYLVKAALRSSAPNYYHYLPTYYGDQLFWSNGTLLTVAQNTASVDIHLQGGISNGGPGFISGNVLQGANKVGDPLSNYQVMVLNMDNTPVQYLYSAADGSFSFNNLAYGTYKLYTEVLGKATEPGIFTISATGEAAQANIYVGNELVTTEKLTGIETISSSITGTSLYPNPVTTSATVLFNAANAGTVTVSLTNVMGQQVLTNKLNTVTGSNQTTLDMGDMAAGIYILQIKDSASKGAIFKIVKQ